jgi:hypothetical protein
MKKMIIGLSATITVAAIILFACNKNEQKESFLNNNLKSSSLSIYEQIAIDHNEGLNYCLKKLIKNTEPISDDEIGRLLRDLIDNIKEYLLNESIFSSEFLSETEVDSLIFQSFRYYEKYKDSGFSNLVEVQSLSATNRTKWNELTTIISSDSKNGIIGFRNSIEDFTSSMDNSKTQSGGDMILFAAYIGRYSADYWYENMEEWADYLISGTGRGWPPTWPPVWPPKWGDVMGADIAGGASGWWGGLKGIISGAITGSAISVIDQVFEIDLVQTIKDFFLILSRQYRVVAALPVFT